MNKLTKEDYLRLLKALRDKDEDEEFVCEYISGFSWDGYMSVYDIERAFDYAYDELKQLINEHFELEGKHEKLIDIYTNEYSLRKISDFKVFKLEMALDKACELLEEYGALTNIYCEDERTFDEWKEYLLKDE